MIMSNDGHVKISGNIGEICADIAVMLMALDEQGVVDYKAIEKIIEINRNKDDYCVDKLFADLAAELANKAMTDAENDSKGDEKCPPHMFWMVEPFNPLE